MDSCIIVKLLGHYFGNDGRTLVRLSHINRLWRTLLRQCTDGALFLFCQKACDRLFIQMNYPQSLSVEAFFVHMQHYRNEMSVADMFRDMALYQTPELYRCFVRSHIACYSLWQTTYICNIVYDRYESREFLLALWDEKQIVHEYGRHVWTGDASLLHPHYGIFVLEKLHRHVTKLKKRRLIE